MVFLKRLFVNNPFTKALSQTPSYAKFLKEILFKKQKLDDHETIALIVECSTIIQNNLLPNLKDIRRVSIPCVMGTISFEITLCDFRANVRLIPLFVCKNLSLVR